MIPQTAVATDLSSAVWCRSTASALLDTPGTDVSGELRRQQEVLAGLEKQAELQERLKGITEGLAATDVVSKKQVAAVEDALRMRTISFDAVKHLLLCRIEQRPPRLDLGNYPHLPVAQVATTAAADYLALLTSVQEGSR